MCLVVGRVEWLERRRGGGGDWFRGRGTTHLINSLHPATYCDNCTSPSGFRLARNGLTMRPSVPWGPRHGGSSRSGGSRDPDSCRTWGSRYWGRGAEPLDCWASFARQPSRALKKLFLRSSWCPSCHTQLLPGERILEGGATSHQSQTDCISPCSGSYLELRVPALP